MALPTLSTPTVGGSADSWGTTINTDLTTLDYRGRPRYDVREWGIAPGTAADQSALINTAISDLNALATGAILVFPVNAWRIDNTITWLDGVALEGIYGGGSAGLAPRMPSLNWYGAAGGTMISMPDSGDLYRHWMYLKNLYLRCKGGTNAAGTGVYLADGPDLGCFFENFAVIGATSYGFDTGAGINMHCRMFRFDGCAGPAVRWRGIRGNCSFSNFTCDNDQGSPSTQGGSFFFLDNNSSYGTTAGTLRLAIHDAKIEVNSKLASGDAMIHLGQQYANGVQVQALLQNVNVEPDPALVTGQYDLLVMDPPTDFVHISLINCKGRVQGIPSFDQALLGTDNYHSHTVLTPYGAHLNLDNSNQQSSNELVGLTNLTGPLRQYGLKASPITYGTTNADFTGANQLSKGQLLAKPGDIGANRFVLIRNKSADQVGGIGALTPTATTTAGSPTVTVSSVTGLKPGLDVQFAGDGGDYTIRYIVDSTHIQLQSNAALSLSGVAMSVLPHSYESFQTIPYVTSAPAAGTWAKGDLAANAGSGNNWGWRCTAAGTPGTWEKVPGYRYITTQLGPFFIAALPGTATTQAKLGVFTGATAVAQNSNDIKIGSDGTVIGAFIISDSARTAGTATVQVRVNGVATAFDGGACVLNATNTTSFMDLTASGGVAFSSGNTLGVAVVTSGWTPTTANVSVFLIVQMDAY